MYDSIFILQNKKHRDLSLQDRDSLCRRNFQSQNSLTSFLSRFRVTFEVSALSHTFPDKIFRETKLEGEK